jgi:hypothetical protein
MTSRSSGDDPVATGSGHVMPHEERPRSLLLTIPAIAALVAALVFVAGVSATLYGVAEDPNDPAHAWSSTDWDQ